MVCLVAICLVASVLSECEVQMHVPRHEFQVGVHPFCENY